jgi:hypothetical protein
MKVNALQETKTELRKLLSSSQSNKFPQNIGNELPDYIVSDLKRQHLHNHHHKNLKYEESLNYKNTKTVKTASVDVYKLKDVIQIVLS